MEKDGQQKFNLNLGQVLGQNESEIDNGVPSLAISNEDSPKRSSPSRRNRNRQSPNKRSRSRRNVVLESSDSSSDIEVDEDLGQASSPADSQAQKKDETAQSKPFDTLPEFDEDDEDDGNDHSKDKLSLLFDLLLTADQCEEPDDVWNYRSFIKDYAKDEENDDDLENEGSYEEEKEEE